MENVRCIRIEKGKDIKTETNKYGDCGKKAEKDPGKKHKDTDTQKDQNGE